MVIGIVGLGVVGQALYDGFLQIGHDVKYHDIKCSESALDNLVDCDIIYVCVPTNTVDDQCDVTQVQDTVSQLNDLGFQGLIGIKSTVIPGTTQQLIDTYPDLSICFVPEFLRARSALADFVNHNDVLIVGTHHKHQFDLIVSCHRHLPKHVVQITPTEAEIAKYFSNLFNALRVVFANGMYSVAHRLGADYQQILDAMIKRPGIPPDYLSCSQHYRAFGGECLPKDSQAFCSFADSIGLDQLQIFRAIVQDNSYHQNEATDNRK